MPSLVLRVSFNLFQILPVYIEIKLDFMMLDNYIESEIYCIYQFKVL
jgi:hypothetical protein